MFQSLRHAFQLLPARFNAPVDLNILVVIVQCPGKQQTALRIRDEVIILCFGRLQSRINGILTWIADGVMASR